MPRRGDDARDAAALRFLVDGMTRKATDAAARVAAE
jgi:hypothetical protein